MWNGFHGNIVTFQFDFIVLTCNIFFSLITSFDIIILIKTVAFSFSLSVKLSEIGILAAAVGGAIMLVLLILGIVLTVRFFRGRRGDAGIELPDSKRGTVW